MTIFAVLGKDYQGDYTVTKPIENIQAKEKIKCQQESVEIVEIFRRLANDLSVVEASGGENDRISGPEAAGSSFIGRLHQIIGVPCVEDVDGLPLGLSAHYGVYAVGVHLAGFAVFVGDGFSFYVQSY